MTDDDRPRPILLGEAPSKAGDRYHHFPLSGRPARVLCELAGIPPQAEGSTYGRWTWALYDHFECSNVFDRYAQATPWSVPAARERAVELLNELRLRSVDPEGEPLAVPAPVLVCLGRKVQAAVFGALDGDARPVKARPGGWGGCFGDFGVWASPWHIYTPVVRQVCKHCHEARRFQPDQCTVGVHGHVYEDRREERWAPHVVTIPHPSGLNRLLNDEAQRARCGEVLRRALELAARTCTVPE